MLKFKRTLYGGQIVDADWWVVTKLIALIAVVGVVTLGVMYPFI